VAVVRSRAEKALFLYEGAVGRGDGDRGVEVRGVVEDDVEVGEAPAVEKLDVGLGVLDDAGA
jgi:hypothetical protein